MNTNEILEAIDQEILKLQQARALLTDAPAIQAAKPAVVKPATGKRRGRPKGSVNKKAEVIAPVVVKKTRAPLSAEGKSRIAAAQKARWAAQKKASTSPKPATRKITANVRQKAAVPAKKSVAELQA